MPKKTRTKNTPDPRVITEGARRAAAGQPGGVVLTQPIETRQSSDSPREPDPEWACSEAAGRLAAVLSLLEDVEADRDPQGWTLRSAVELLGTIQEELQAEADRCAAHRGTAVQ